MKYMNINDAMHLQAHCKYFFFVHLNIAVIQNVGQPMGISNGIMQEVSLNLTNLQSGNYSVTVFNYRRKLTQNG